MVITLGIAFSVAMQVHVCITAAVTDGEKRCAANCLALLHLEWLEGVAADHAPVANHSCTVCHRATQLTGLGHAREALQQGGRVSSTRSAGGPCMPSQGARFNSIAPPCSPG